MLIVCKAESSGSVSSVISTEPGLVPSTKSSAPKPAQSTESSASLSAQSTESPPPVPENRMRMAIEEHKKGGIGIRQLTRAWSLPKSTLQRRLCGKAEGFSHASGRKTAFSAAQEKELADLLKSMSRGGFPLVGAKVKKIAFQHDENHGIMRFNADRGTAGVYWLNGFLARNGLSLRKPETLLLLLRMNVIATL